MKKVKHIYLNYSSYDLYYSCKRKFEYNTIHNLLPVVGEENEDPSTKGYFKGSVIHNCIDAHNKGLPWLPVFEAAIAPKHYAIHNLKPTQSGSVKHLKDIIQGYFQHYSNERRNVIHTEKKLYMPLNERVTLVGTIDEIDEADGIMRIVDHKTSTSLGRFMEPTIHVSDQFTMYVALAQANGINTDQVMVNGISTALTNFRKWQSGDDKDGMFLRYETVRTKAQIDEFLAMIAFEADRMISDIENNTFTKTPKKGTCVEFNSKCPYLDVCSAQPQNRAQILKNNFETGVLDNASFRIEWEK